MLGLRVLKVTLSTGGFCLLAQLPVTLFIKTQKVGYFHLYDPILFCWYLGICTPPQSTNILFLTQNVQTIGVYVIFQSRCDEVAEALTEQGLQAAALHGGRSQSEREAALRDFRHGPTRILVATDVASRGLDVTGVAHVINLDLPKTMEDYVHRIGRTGRAGSTGQATSFYTDRDVYLVAQIRKAIQDADSGNTITYAIGKTARRKEKEAIAAQKEAKVELSKLSLVGSTGINVEDKYRHMIAPAVIRKEGAADDAWDD